MRDEIHRMKTASRMPRILLAIAALLAASGLTWWLADRDPEPGRGVVRAVASPAALHGSPQASIPAAMENQILEAIGKPGARIRDVRIVDQERQIACGELIDPGSEGPRRFVWLSQLRQLVTDDGGQDFAILVHVCTPPPSP